ncbi:uncharacterized protein LOC125951454 isoform X2 [Anopheles darlingi]|uniref:uncharacterized protein LOC125951454 isoform X2 n=1 Tax=Anopheles darlingi TaxID=43151 RepID=UPI0021000B13|nr:uncharacterized protein LOC125951454 isoform X2 [Anopheles darlingi]
MDEAAARDKRSQEIEKEYLSSLADLNVNSKPLINMLTILAEENVEYAQVIVKSVENHLAQVGPEVKLPILYLVDSIVKNVGKQYQSLFSQVIVNMFCGVFETVNERVREKMFGLRQTWNDVFPQSKLYALDIKINSIDPGWPITAQMKPKGPAIHINPNFLKGVPEQTAAIHAELEKKRQELLELQTRKLELELLATKKRIEEQEKQLSLQADSVAKGLPSTVRKTLENPSMVHPSGAIAVAAAPVVAGGVTGVGGITPKTRIAPVSQSMINSMMNSRDPRLLKHQATVGTNSTQSQSAIAHRPSGGGAAAIALPPHGIVPVGGGGNMLSEPSATESNMASKASNAVVKERLGGRGKRIVEGVNSVGITKQEYGSDNGTVGGARLKKMSSLGSSTASSHKSRHDHHEGGKTRKDRISKDQMSTARSNGSKGSSGSSGSSPSKSSTTARTVSGGEKRKQHGTTNDTSPQGRKSPHTGSPGKKKSSDIKISPSSSDGGRSSKHESKSLPTIGKIRKIGTNRSDSAATPLAVDIPSGTAVAVAQDVDLRYMMPDKRMKIDGTTTANHHSTSDVMSGAAPAAAQQQDVDERASLVSMMGPKASSFDVQSTSSNAQAEEDALSALISKDIDLRKLPLQLIPNTPMVEHGGDKQHDGSRTTPTAIPSARAEDSSNRRSSTDGQELDEYAGGKKRSSTAKTEEPMAKKSKAEMIDALFGNEDVDLRQLPPVLVRQDGTNSPPPATSGRVTGGIVDVDSTRPDKTNRPSRFTDAAKSHDKDKLGRPLLYNKLPDDPIERRRSISSLTTQPGDVDMRQSLHHIPPPRLDQSALDQDEDSSMDSMNANIKTIVAQAQEQMEKGEINLEQYNILMKQVIQLNETQKIRQAQRIEQRQEPPPIIRIDDNGSLSGEDDVIITSATPGIQVPTGPPVGGMGRPPLGEVGVNNFRGKIHPLDGGKMGPGPMGTKPPFESPFVANTQTSVPPPDHRVSRDPRRMRESKWNRVEPPNTTPAWANRVGPAVPTGATTGLVRGAINVPSPWEQAPFPMPPIVGEQPANRFGPVNGLAVLGAGLPGAVLPGALLNGGPPPPISTVTKLNDSVRTINIDSIQREIRFYEETAVVFMNWDEPKEIGFQKGARMVVVDDRETFELGFNEPYKSVSIENHVYQMRLGAPTRELYIDDSWYECYFGDPPTTITLDGKQRVFKISGPPPQVKIGDSRNDLVAGKINMIIDAELIVPVFLDCKPQLFEINGHQHRLQFADFLLTVLIDEQPFPVEYGGLPKVFRLRERSYYIRFTAVPKLVVPGRVYIRDMVRTPLYRDLRTPPKDASLLPTLPPLGGPPVGIGPAPGAGGGVGAPVPHLPPGTPGGVSGFGAQVRADTQNASSTGLDYLTNLMPAMAMQTQGAGMGKHPAYRIESDEKISNSLDSPGGASNQIAAAGSGGGGGGLSLLGNINVGELYKKIVAAGIITNLGGQGAPPAINPSSSNTTAATEAAAPTTSKGSRGDRADSRNARMAPIEPVRLDQPDMLRKRQAAIVYQLFSGMQCSSCGVRFPPEQTMKYSQHLDWHFRQNRRDRDSARKAHSRKWYYDVSDWIQYEEIEDLEEREKNWFETQQGAGDHQGDSRMKAGGIGSSGGGSNGGIGVMGGDDGEDGGSAANNDSPQPSCPAGTNEDDRQCHMCHDVFEQFYNEETEDWHLKCAIRIDGYTYHPLCYEDYKASLTMSESTLGNTLLDGTGEQSFEESQKEGEGDMDASESTGEDGTDEQGADGEPGDRKIRVKTRKRKAKEGDNAGDKDSDDNDDDDDDDVIVLPTVEPVVEEILDDEAELLASEKKSAANDGGSDDAGDSEAQKSSTSKPNSPQAPRQPEFQERQIDEDLFIQEPNIEVTDLDDIEDFPAGGGSRTVTQPSNGAGDGTTGGDNDAEGCLQIKIKEEPKDEDEADEEDALFEDVGTIESSVIEIACGSDHQSPNPITTTIPMEEDVGEDSVAGEIMPSSPGDTSNQMGTTVTATPAQMASKASIDGNVELQDAPQASVVVPNKIKINITTSKSNAAATQLQQQQQQQQQNLAANEGDETNGVGSGGTNGGTGTDAEFVAVGHASSSRGTSPIGRGNHRGSRELGEDGMFEELSNDGGSGWEEVEEKDERVEQQQQQQQQQPNKEQANELSASSTSGVAFEETTDVAYELKTGLQGIELNRQPRVTSGYEASGLCSIM